MSDKETFTADPRVTYSSDRSDGGSNPDLRILHYNDVYHVDPASAEPVGGLARFITMCNEYKDAEKFKGQPDLLTLFSGDAFNPSLESSVTKGTASSALRVPSSNNVILQVNTWFLS